MDKVFRFRVSLADYPTFLRGLNFSTPHREGRIILNFVRENEGEGGEIWRGGVGEGIWRGTL